MWAHDQPLKIQLDFEVIFYIYFFLFKNNSHVNKTVLSAQASSLLVNSTNKQNSSICLFF